MTDVICGQGRLGRRVMALLAAEQRPLLPLRLDSKRGLYQATENGVVPSRIDLLVICLVPRHPDGGSGWAGLLDGLLAQQAREALLIKRVVLVSSTAVYESYACGWVDAHSPVIAGSERSAGLIEAEERVRQLSPDHCIIRLTGLCGEGYERYDPVRMSVQQPRHAVDVQSAAVCIATLALRATARASTELVTDGFVYHQQQRYIADRQQPILAALAAQHRLMIPSYIATAP